MKIAIVTVYHPFTNLGSYLQAYALQIVLNGLGHDVYFVNTGSKFKSIYNLLCHLNPKREFLLRFQKAYFALKDLSKFKIIDIDRANHCDLLIFGSDEIWNVTNKFFQQPVFWGLPFENKPMIGYAISAVHATNDDFRNNVLLTSNIKSFSEILTRDIHTQSLLNEHFNIKTKLVADPTLLVNANLLSKEINIPKDNYLLVYTYGINPSMIKILKQFAKKHSLKIISPCFWHPWVDSTIECSALQLGTLMRHAKYVFTTTFHGTIFSLINHTKCCILPLRDKVRDVCETLKCEERLIDESITFDSFERIICKNFSTHKFEQNLLELRNDSFNTLNSVISKHRK